MASALCRDLRRPRSGRRRAGRGRHRPHWKRRRPTGTGACARGPRLGLCAFDHPPDLAFEPHRSERSSDPLFVEKVRDIVGLYLSPRVVLCVDEKSQIQALDRSRPLLPMRPGQIERRTHDYMRHGTTTLSLPSTSPPARSSGSGVIAAGSSSGSCAETLVPDDLDVHLVMDNYATHKKRWLVGHRARSTSRGRFLAEPGRALLRRRKTAPAGVHRRELEPIRTYIGQHRPATLLDQVRRRHPRHHQTLLPAHSRNRRTAEGNHQNFRIRTLERVWH